MLLGHVTCKIGAHCNIVAMVTKMLEQRLFHLESVLDGSIVTQFVKMAAKTRVCGMGYDSVWVCVYEIWSSVLEGSFVTHLGKIAGVWSMEYGIWGMAVWGMGYGGMTVWGMEYGVWSMAVWGMGYGGMTVWGMEYGGMAVWGMHIFIHTTHVWKCKSHCEHNY